MPDQTKILNVYSVINQALQSLHGEICIIIIKFQTIN